MTLAAAIQAHGMTPPQHIPAGRWVRFPGIGKGRANRSGWCRLITPTLAIFGDWSSGLTETWRDDAHVDDARSRQLMRDARTKERQFAAEQRRRQEAAALSAAQIVRAAAPSTHPYLVRKGFPSLMGLVRDGKLVVPIRDVANYATIISAQLIDEAGEKRFVTGGRTRGGIYCIGASLTRAKRIVLCEGYATGLSLDAALQRLLGPHTVIVCFSAQNMERIAERFPSAVIAADNDASKTGETVAKRTGLPWVMPSEVGQDWNDVHVQLGLHAVVEGLRTV